MPSSIEKTTTNASIKTNFLHSKYLVGQDRYQVVSWHAKILKNP